MLDKAAVLDSWFKLSLIPKRGDENCQSSTSSKQRVYLGDHLPGVYLTRREAECVYYLMHQAGRSRIAQLMGLSRRTIDTYIEAVKKKLRCHSQQVLLCNLKQTDFLGNIQRLGLKFVIELPLNESKKKTLK